MNGEQWWDRLRNVAHGHALDAGPAHDFGHVLRVEANVRLILRTEKAEPLVVLPAAILHELRSYPKDHPDSPRSGEICAEEATAVLREQGYPGEWIEPIADCIREHPFSRGLVPSTAEGRILQDADRLDAIGAIGLARCFAVCGEIRRPLYSPADPFCESRRPNDKEFGLDHFYTKLLHISEKLHTETARSMGRERTTFLRSFLAQLRREI